MKKEANASEAVWDENYLAQNFENIYQPFHPRSALQRPNFQGHGTTRNTALKIETW